ncbi:ribosome biogenesis protein NOP53 [Typha latifolia]|uniref:ribosome biogenesis protein NOP53 n=1 Tax=Typha latifolia TaxID=4733 RepID=UPI003C30A125
MGKKAKGSRKGKKAWRANISTEDIDEYFEKTTKDALSGAAALPSLKSDSLFYVDKSKDIPIKRKIEKKREKVLHCESILQRNPFVQVVPSSVSKKSKEKKRTEVLNENSKSNDVSKVDDPDSMHLDLWDEKDLAGEANAKAKKRSTTSLIPAVEVEPPGCSFNPPFEAHQDSLARAVADEMQKIYKKELGPQPVPLTVPGEIVAEEDKYFLDADDENENDTEEDPEHASDDLAAPLKSKTKRVTRVKLNRRARHKEQLKTQAEAKKLENLSKEIDSLPDIMEEIAKEDEEKQRRHCRRVIARQERLKSAPPRLGKHKFEPAPVQVLLTEEISGSLRKLKGCCTLARDRFKSFEKRGLLVPRAKNSRR